MIFGRASIAPGLSVSPGRRQALADAYVPIVRGFLLPALCYYAFVTWGHWQDERGFDFLILGGLSALTVIVYFVLRQVVLVAPKVSLATVELSGLVASLLIYANVVAYLLIHFEEAKLVYFVLMAAVFATSGVTFRTTLLCVAIAMATLYGFALRTDPATLNQFLFIGVATSFASLGMASLLRKALMTQVNARLRADGLATTAKQLADTDTLTGLPNRRAILNRLDADVAARRRTWLGLLDLDGFKAINDAYGHVFGDTLLCAVADRAQRVVGADVCFGRLGGDEFAVIVPGTLTPQAIEAYGNRLIDVISQPYTVDSVQVAIGASGGFCHYPDMVASSDALYEKADFSLYRAKESRRGASFVFDARHEREMVRTIAIERALREGDLEAELYPVFQPQFSLARGRVMGFEALARWNSDTLGEVRPDVFIRAAERSGHIRRMTQILFAKALAEARLWPEHISMSFNLSGHDLSDRAVAAELLSQIRASGIAPQRIEFEATETAAMVDLETTRAIMTELSHAGCKIALDDFGSGYSSFRYIDQLPLDKIKIDRSFVRRIPTNATSREIVLAILALCRKLRLDCVLEGVETEAELAALRPLAPDIIQGFLFGRPMAASDALELIADGSFEDRERQVASA